MSIGCVSSKMFFSRTTASKMPIFTELHSFNMWDYFAQILQQCNVTLNEKSCYHRINTKNPVRGLKFNIGIHWFFNSFFLRSKTVTVCEIAVQGSSSNVDSILLKPFINNGPMLVPQKGTQSVKGNNICYKTECYKELFFSGERCGPCGSCFKKKSLWRTMVICISVALFW